jgi:hypothetical protein
VTSVSEVKVMIGAGGVLLVPQEVHAVNTIVKHGNSRQHRYMCKSINGMT